MILLLGRDNCHTLSVIERAARARGMTTLRLDSHALVHHLSVCDVVSGEKNVKIEWTVNGTTFTGGELAGVVNLLDEVDYAEFDHVHPSDRQFAWHEFRAYLMFALSSFPNVINPPSGEDLCGSARSLCFQWLAMQQMDSSIAVPRWLYGLSRECTLLSVQQCCTVVSNDPFDVNHWNPRMGPSVDPHTPYLFYEVPFGQPVQAMVFDEQSWIWPSASGDYVPEAVEQRIRELSVRLTRVLGLRWAQTQFFYSTHPQRLMFGAIQAAPDLAWAPALLRAPFIDAMMKVMQSRSRDEPGGHTRATPGPRNDRTLIPDNARLIPTGSQIMPAAATVADVPEARGVLIIASQADPTAQYFSRVAHERGIAITWWPADQLIELSSRFVETLLRPHPTFSVYYRRPGTADLQLYKVLCLLDDLLESFDGPVVGNTLHFGSNHSKPLHVARCEATLGNGVRVVPTVVRSGGLISNETQVVKALSAQKAEVVLLSALAVSNGTYPAPVQLQTLVRGTNIRVHVCDGTSAAVEIQSNRLDYRFDSQFGVRPRQLPRELEEWCIEAAAHEGIVFAGIDLLYEGQTYYCLEINPNPGYHVFEERLRESGHAPLISDCLFRHLNVFGAA